MCIRIKGDCVYQGHIDFVTGHDIFVCCDIYHSADDAASIFPVLVFNKLTFKTEREFINDTNLYDSVSILSFIDAFESFE